MKRTFLASLLLIALLEYGAFASDESGKPKCPARTCDYKEPDNSQ